MDASTAGVVIGIIALFLGLWQMNNSLNERMDSFNVRLDELRRDLERKIEREVDGVRRELSNHIDRNYSELFMLRVAILGSDVPPDAVFKAYRESLKKAGGVGNGSES